MEVTKTNELNLHVVSEEACGVQRYRESVARAS